MTQAGKFRSVLFAAVMAAAAAGSAQDKHDHHDHGAKKEAAAGEKKDEHAGHDHGHAHEAPHGGALVVLGEEFAHLEFVVDAAKGKLTAYALDAHAEKSLRLKQPEIEVALRPEGEGATTTTLRLQAAASPLTGEMVGNSSEFSAKSDKLKGVKKFQGVVRNVTIKGSEFKDVSFRYPEGNE